MEASGDLFPNTPLHVEKLRAMNMDVTLDARKVVAPDYLPVQALSFRVLINNGVAKANPIKLAVVGGGSITGELGIDARTDTGLHTGVWVGDAKLAAIGMRVSRAVTSHGFALNCATDLAMFDAIVACGLPEARACSLSGLLGRSVGVADTLPLVERHLAERLGRTPVAVDAATLDLPADDYWPEDPLPVPQRAVTETIHV
jgi:hypothetical protein